MLRVEQLENRDVPYVINLDFSGFSSIFRPEYLFQLNFVTQGAQANRINWRDQVRLQNKIAARMRTDFPGYTVRINKTGDFNVKFGGDHGDGIIGLAPVGSSGVNASGTCRVYSDTLWKDIINSRSFPLRSEIINSFAQAASHEVGHMLGLDHLDGTIMMAITPLPAPVLRFNSFQKTEIKQSISQNNYFFPDEL